MLFVAEKCSVVVVVVRVVIYTSFISYPVNISPEGLDEFLYENINNSKIMGSKENFGEHDFGPCIHLHQEWIFFKKKRFYTKSSSQKCIWEYSVK